MNSNTNYGLECLIGIERVILSYPEVDKKLSNKYKF